jgi:hypothetical protein
MAGFSTADAIEEPRSARLMRMNCMVSEKIKLSKVNEVYESSPIDD